MLYLKSDIMFLGDAFEYLLKTLLQNLEKILRKMFVDLVILDEVN